jgi:hypothetical protein
MRARFADIACRLQSREKCTDAVLVALGELNRRYHTRAPRLPILCEALIQTILESGWLGSPPSLFDGPADELRTIAKVVPTIIEYSLAGGATRKEYSLVTKFLHFCFPTTFVIYDVQAACSIRTWAWFAFDDDSTAEMRPADRFDVLRLSDTQGSGYGGLMLFYRTVWNASSQNARRELLASAAGLSSRCMSGSHLSETSVSPIDVIDKLIWYASGNPIRLGLAEPPKLDAGVH